MKLGIYILAPEPISTAYFINLYHQSVCLHVYSAIVARQKRYRGNEYTRNNKRIVGRVVSYAVSVVSKEINSSQNLFYKGGVILTRVEGGRISPP
jgi:hypothetical protein